MAAMGTGVETSESSGERGLSRFLTRERIRAYPAVTFAVLLALAVYDRLAGKGLLNAFDGALGGDFLSFYTGGAFVLRGRSLDLLSESAQLAFQRRVLGANVEGISVWVSPPYFAWFFSPLSLLPYPVAYVVFVAFSVTIVTVAFRALTRTLGLHQSTARTWWVVLQYYPTLQWLLNGQITGLWLSVFIFVFLSLRAGRDARAGLALGLFACKPTLALGLAMALLVARRWVTLSCAVLTTTALLAVGFVTVPAAMREYLDRGPALVSFVRESGYHLAGLHGSFEFATLLLDGFSRRLASVAGLLVCGALVAAAGSQWLRAEWNAGSRIWDLRMTVTLALGVIASPHLYGYDLALLALPLWIVAARTSSTSGLPLDGGPVLRASAFVWALGLLGPALALAQEHLTRRILGVAAIVQLGVLAIIVWAMRVHRLAFDPGRTC
jgi:hypothetical protein